MTPDIPRPDEAERQAADELSRLGQEMRLDEARHSPTHQNCCSTPDVRCTRWCAECDTTLESGCPAEALSAALRGMARRSVQWRNEATYWASGDWQAENRKLRAELATLRAGRPDDVCLCQFGSVCKVCWTPPSVSPVPEQGREEALCRCGHQARRHSFNHGACRSSAECGCGRFEPSDQPDAGGPGEREDPVEKERKRLSDDPTVEKWSWSSRKGFKVTRHSDAPAPVPVESRALDVLRRLVELNSDCIDEHWTAEFVAIRDEARALLDGESK